MCPGGCLRTMQRALGLAGREDEAMCANRKLGKGKEVPKPITRDSAEMVMVRFSAT